LVEEAVIPIDEQLLGVWELENPDKDKAANERMLVTQHSANEYLVVYGAVEKAMIFRAFPIRFDDTDWIQIQLIGSMRGPVAERDRKFHLMRASVDGDRLSLSILKAAELAEPSASTAQLREAIAGKSDDASFFDAPKSFRRVKP
jgi:hypothetical protein